MTSKKSIISLLILLSTLVVLPIRAQSPTDTAAGTITEAEALSTLEKARTKLELHTHLGPEGFRKLPAGIVRNIGGKDYVVAFVKSHHRPRKGRINAFFAFPFPGSDKQLAFVAEGLSTTPGSLSMADGAILRLVSRVEIPFGDKAKLILKNDGRNFIEIDCNGFRRVHLSGDIEFNEGFIVSADTAAKRVVSSFEIEASDPGNLLTTFSLRNFKLAALPDFTFSVDQATLDFSDLANAPGMAFPAGYVSAYGAFPELWQGFYLRNARMYMPNFLSCDKSKPLIVNAGNLIIDKAGFSGSLSVTGLAEDTCANSSSWPITLNTFEFTMVRNSLKACGFSGNIILRELDNERFRYTASVAIIDNKPDFLFVLGIDKEKTYKLPLLSSTLTLHPSSTVSIQYTDGGLIPAALLNGTLAFNQKPLNTKFRFEGLLLTTKSPYVDFKLIANDDTYSKSIGGFTLSVSNIELRKPDANHISLGLTAGVTLASDFSGAVKLAIWAERSTVTGRWGYDKLVIDSIAISAKTSAITLEGFIAVYKDDPVYGDGFAGGVKMGIQSLVTDISATALFGKKDGFRYWYADASVTLSKGIPCGFISLYGFKGGAYQFMQQQNVDKFSKRGAIYVPDRNTAFGFKAGVTLGLSKEKTFNADVLLEVSFNTHGGINRVMFAGDAYFMASISERQGKSPSDLPLYAGIYIDYNRANKEFLASVEAYVNIGNGLIRGVNPGNFAGRCEFYFGPSQWYVHMGRPDVPLGVTLLDMVRTSGYFMAGKLVGLPPILPPQLAKLSSQLQPMNWSDLSEGSGVATGAQISVNAGGELGIFYASLSVGGGFDVVLYDFGSAAHCAGSTEPLGINGWYAMGQSYVWLQGCVGVQVKIRGKARRFDVLSLGAAALLQAELPNPLWMQGGITGSYSVLGGLVKGGINYTFEIGEKCDIVRGRPNLADIEVISAITPAEGANNIDVFTTPQVVFNLAVNKSLPVEGYEYKIILDEFTVTGAGQNLTGNFVWNADQTTLVLKRDKILPPLSDIVITTRIHWQEKTGSTWADARDESGVITESKTVKFRSGEAPNYIPGHNVTYCYPKQKQVNFYKLEYPTGYIKLNVDQDYLFKPVDDKGKRWTLRAVFVEGTNQWQSAFTYDLNNYEVQFPIPASLTLNKKMKVYFKKVPATQAGMDDNVTAVETTATDEGGGDLTITTREAEGAVAVGEEVTVYEIEFRTSAYETVTAKWAKARYLGNYMSNVGIGQIQNLRYTFDEGFEADELVYEVGTESEWYKTFIYPVIYEHYPFGGHVSYPADKGIPPLRAIRPEILAGTTPDYNSVTYPTVYTSAIYWDFTDATFLDFYRAKDKATELLLSGKTMHQALLSIINRYYVYRIRGNFNVYVYYKLPGKDTIVGSGVTLPFNL